jgi:hypothetical protein
MSENPGTIESPRRRWTQVSWKRIALALGLTFAGLASLLPIAWFLEPWYFAREISRNDASLSVTPVALQNKTVSALASGRLQCFEFSFQTPWEKVGIREDLKSATWIRFTNGPAILAFDPAWMPSVQKAVRTDAKKLENVFGQRAMSSGYDWMSAELATTPSQIHWWDRTGNARTAVLLGLKESEVLRSPVIYKVENDEVRGFQIGQPGPAPVRVTLELFDVNNRRYEIIIGTRYGEQVVTQADINSIIASFRPIPHS